MTDQTRPAIYGRPTTDRQGVHPDAKAMGVTIALDAETAGWWEADEWAEAVRHYQPQLLEALRRYVGGARPQTVPQAYVDGPHSDPIQGTLYVMTCYAFFIPADLPADCDAYLAEALDHG